MDSPKQGFHRGDQLLPQQTQHPPNNVRRCANDRASSQQTEYL